MLASERRVTTVAGANGLNPKHPGVTQILKPGRAVKIYVIDPRKFQERLEKYVGDLKNTGSDNNNSTNKDGKEIKVSSSPQIVPIQKLQNQQGDQSSLPVVVNKNNINNNNTDSTPTVSNPSSNVPNDKEVMAEVEVLKAEDKPKRSPPKRKGKKKKVVGVKKIRKVSISEEKEGAAELAYLMKETTTRTGRVSKSSTAAAAAVTAAATTIPIPIPTVLSQPASPAGSIFSSGQNSSVPSPSPSISSVNSQGQRVKKREPPEMFRCQTCRKVYLGHTKLNLHFQKFPEHQKSEVPVVKTKKKAATVANNNKANDEFKNSNDNKNEDYLTLSPSASFLINNNSSSVVPNVTQSTVESQTDPIPDNEESTHSENNDPVEQSGSPISNRRVTTINPDTLSDNCSSPKLPESTSSSSEVQTDSERIYNSTEMDPVFLQANSTSSRQSQDALQPITVPNLPTDEGSISARSEYFNFQTDFNPLPEISQIPSELIGNGSCSQQSFNINSLDNLLADSNSPRRQPSPSSTSSSGRSSNTNVQPSSSSTVPASCRSNGSNFFSGSSKFTTTIQNSTTTVSSSFQRNCRNGSIPSGDEESRDVCINNLEDSHHGTENSLDGCEIQVQPSPSTSTQAAASALKRKSIWEFVKEQIRVCGINQACGEISEMAEKLSKVARDKFYPIREEEIERLGGTPPIIQVETPFISHLLDLPFGTYIFKEDGGIRRIIPPPTPVSSDLSLTGGVEVDIDKFLSPDIDLISLPHLTNLDFAAICNE